SSRPLQARLLQNRRLYILEGNSGQPPMQTLLLALIRAYRYLLSPWIGGQCRFEPTCSIYAMQAIELDGPWRGSWLALQRLLRCHPFWRGGRDPVPGYEDDEDDGMR